MHLMCVDVWLCVCMHVCLCACVCMCVCLCVCVCVCVHLRDNRGKMSKVLGKVAEKKDSVGIGKVVEASIVLNM